MLRVKGRIKRAFVDKNRDLFLTNIRFRGGGGGGLGGSGSGSGSGNGAPVVPEPGSLLMMAIGSLMGGAWLRRRKSQTTSEEV